MRTALRTFLVTAALAGALLAPAAGSAFAASGTPGADPVAVAGTGKQSTCVSVVKHVVLGAGLAADLTMSPKGPQAAVISGDQPYLTLNRSNPKGPDGYYLRIANPNGAAPVLEWKTEGGDAPVKRTSFPALPKGCVLDHKVTQEAAGTPAPKPSSSATAAPKKVTTQTTGQTTVVPKGAVAAGAEIPAGTARAAEDTDNTTTVAAGAGLVAVFGALGATLLMRRRRAQG